MKRKTEQFCRNCGKDLLSILPKRSNRVYCSNDCIVASTYSNPPFEPEKRKEIIFKLAEKYGWVCWYCNLPLSSSSVKLYPDAEIGVVESRQISIHIDHIVPKSHGGTDDLANLALSCEFCNRAKSNVLLEVFLSWLDRIRFADTWVPIRDGRRGVV